MVANDAKFFSWSHQAQSCKLWSLELAWAPTRILYCKAARCLCRFSSYWLYGSLSGNSCATSTGSFFSVMMSYSWNVHIIWLIVWKWSSIKYYIMPICIANCISLFLLSFPQSGHLPILLTSRLSPFTRHLPTKKSES